MQRLFLFRSTLPSLVVVVASTLAVASTRAPAAHRRSPAASATTNSAQAFEGVYLELDFADRENGWNEHGVRAWLSADALRLDLGSTGLALGDVSLLLFGGQTPRLLLLNHRERTVQRCTTDDVVPNERNPVVLGDYYFGGRDARDPLLALPAGNEKTVGDWPAREVMLREPGPERERVPKPFTPGEAREVIIREYDRHVATLWLSDAVAIARPDFGKRLVAVLQPYIDAGGSGFWLHSLLLTVAISMDLHPIPDLPDGFPVEIVIGDPERPNATTVLKATRVAPIDPQVFAIPDEYHLGTAQPCFP